MGVLAHPHLTPYNARAFDLFGRAGAQVAQLVEQRIENPRVGGSNPPLGTTPKPLI